MCVCDVIMCVFLFVSECISVCVCVCVGVCVGVCVCVCVPGEMSEALTQGTEAREGRGLNICTRSNTHPHTLQQHMCKHTTHTLQQHICKHTHTHTHTHYNST